MIHEISEIKLLSKEIFNEILSVRRHIHKHPELSFKEYKTSEFICSILDKHKITYTKNIVETGIIAIIECLIG
jgi:hippurate hydrolase